MLKANQQGILSWHRTLRRYLDLLVEGKVLTMKEKDVGSVNPQQLYSIHDKEAHLWTGLTILSLHGLNWDTSETDMRTVNTDLAALVRARTLKIGSETKLATGLEDSLAYELERDAKEQNGTVQLVASMIATHPIDLAYFLRRADLLDIGQSARDLITKIGEAYNAIPPDVDGRTFIETRERFLKLQQLYRTRGTFKLVDSKGRGEQASNIIQDLTAVDIISASGKQLGVNG